MEPLFTESGITRGGEVSSEGVQFTAKIHRVFVPSYKVPIENLYKCHCVRNSVYLVVCSLLLLFFDWTK